MESDIGASTGGTIAANYPDAGQCSPFLASRKGDVNLRAKCGPTFWLAYHVTGVWKLTAALS